MGIFLMDLEAKKAMLRDKQEDVRQMGKKLKDKGQKMSKTAATELRKNLYHQVKELRRLKDDLEDELKRKNMQLKRKLAQEISEVVRAHLKKKKYTIILDKRSVIAADEAIDITDEIIKEFDARKKKK